MMKKRNFEKDLEAIHEKVEKDLDFAIDVYGALCNMRWGNTKDPDDIYSCTWRYAGGIVAAMRGNYDGMNYMDFYCSGNEGVVTDEIKEIFRELGWEPLPYTDDDFK